PKQRLFAQYAASNATALNQALNGKGGPTNRDSTGARRACQAPLCPTLSRGILLPANRRSPTGSKTFVRAAIHQHPGTLRPLLALVWPVMAEQLLVMLVGFVDTLLAGHYLEAPHLAAMTVIAYALWFFTNLFAFVAIGAVAMTARFVGADDWPAAN